MVCSIVASACRPEIITSPRQDRAAENRNEIVHVEIPPAVLAEAVALHDAVVVLVTPDLIEHVLAHPHRPLRDVLRLPGLLAGHGQAQDAPIRGYRLDHDIVTAGARVAGRDAPDAALLARAGDDAQPVFAPQVGS